VLAAATALASAGAHAGEEIRLSFDPAVVTLSPGVPSRVVLRAEGVPAPGLAAFQVEIGYEPGQAEVRDPNQALGSSDLAAFAPLGHSPLCAPLRGVTPCADPAWLLASTGRQPVGRAWLRPAEGRVVIAYGSHGDAKPAVGSGALALLEVVGRSSGRTRLRVLDAILADASDPPRPYAWRLLTKEGMRGSSSSVER
jgi:hypothetical protein